MMEEQIEEQAPAEALYSDDEIEVFVNDEQGGDPAQSALIDELKAKQAELAAQVDPVKAMREAITGLSHSIAPQQAPVDVSVRANGVADWQAYKEQFNQKVFEDPFQMVTDLVSKSAEMQSASVANQNLAYSKRIVMIDPATSSHYKRWADEVEREVAKMPVSVRASNPNVYEDALKVVRANHLDELIEEKLAQAQPAQVKSAARPTSYSEAGTARASVPVQQAAPQGRSQVRVSASKMNEISAYAAEWGIPEEAAIRLFQKRGRL